MYFSSRIIFMDRSFRVMLLQSLGAWAGSTPASIEIKEFHRAPKPLNENLGVLSISPTEP
jgi:hypothetical protein